MIGRAMQCEGISAGGLLRGTAAVIAGGMLFATTCVFSARAVSLQLLSTNAVNPPLPAGGNGNSVAPVISADGRFILFASSANNLLPGDNHMLGMDVFLRDQLSNTIVLVSANLSGNGGGNGSSIHGNFCTRSAIGNQPARERLDAGRSRQRIFLASGDDTGRTVRCVRQHGQQ